SLVVQLLKELRKKEQDELLRGWLEQYWLDFGTDLDSIIAQEHFEQASRKVAVGHAIMSLKTISRLDWEEVFENLSRVELILARDPDGTYPNMDKESRDYYRRQVGLLARRYRVPEPRVARIAVGLAKQVDDRELPSSHVGYYLIGKGREKLIRQLNGSAPVTRLHNYPPARYYSAIAGVMAVVIVPLAWYGYRFSQGSLVVAVSIVLLSLLPVSEIAVFLVNRLAARLVAAAFLPKLSFGEGIPDRHATMVVIPALLPNAGKVEELLERLETYYLANKSENLYFALAGDYKDGDDKTAPEDQAIIQAGLQGVQRLNEEYGEGEELFFYCQRERVLCPTQNRWTGWERKRGALVEFNRLLLGEEDTTYNIQSPGLTGLANKIKYVITLDADTRLTLDTAKKLIGTMAHPLHRPVIDQDKGIVKEGYGLIQPRIGIGVESANQSEFTRLFAGAGGIDPYVTAVSDVYQDLFGEGIFTGKGIYDLQVFHRLLTNAIPEGSILSHDLLEGSYLRTGMATDVELIDGYPGTYSSYAARQHRWVRGDWQLLPWLFPRIKNRQGRWVKNPLSGLSKWK
ncbi:MAG: glycosyl transferase, partial [Clostridia bacterium]|nr:glycosyl transferase [Clostridia bacterium]